MERELLRRAAVALNDWTHTYASEFCDSEHVAQAWARIREAGGTVAYIADLVSEINAFLAQVNESHCDRCEMLEMEIEAIEEKLAEARTQTPRPANVLTSDTSSERVDETSKQRHEQEPVAICEYCEKERPVIHAEGKPWVGLTDEEIDKTHETQVWDARRSYARAIEAKLREKNA